MGTGNAAPAHLKLRFAADGVAASPRRGALLAAVEPLRRQVAEHGLYGDLRSLAHLRLFMEHHVFAVWDFMSLVKALQSILTRTTVPWSPKGNAMCRRLINEIVLDEESDEDGQGGYLSHFELYLQAMVRCGADTSAIHAFLRQLALGTKVPEALELAGAPPASRAFTMTTWSIIESGPPHAIAAAFALGREEIVPEMFQAVIAGIRRDFPNELERFDYYLSRHIEVDKDRHGPMSMKMLEVLCGEDDARWQAAAESGKSALAARLLFWDGVQERLRRNPA